MIELWEALRQELEVAIEIHDEVRRIRRRRHSYYANPRNDGEHDGYKKVLLYMEDLKKLELRDDARDQGQVFP